MKFIDKIASRQETDPFYSFEFFPPRTDQGFANLLARITRLSCMNPLAISVTWGAGGSTKQRSLELAGLAQETFGIMTLLHLTCTNMEASMVDEALRTAKKRGIQNIIALRGDPPRGEEHWTPIDQGFNHGVDLVSYIRSNPEYSSYFCIGVAAYPDGHPEQAGSQDLEIQHLKAKVHAGADFIITQLFYDVNGYLKWERRVKESGVSVPIIPCIMPIQSYASFLRITTLCGTRTPFEVLDALNPLRHDDKEVKEYGIRLSISMIRQLSAAGVPGFHFCTLNLEKSVQQILEELGWVRQAMHVTPNKLISEWPGRNDAQVVIPPRLVISPSEAAATAAHGLEDILPSAATSTSRMGKGELNNAVTWDEFPNGRFGDAKSPAFGAQDPWSGGSTIPVNKGIPHWGNPKSTEELTGIFISYLDSKIPSTPFSSGPLSLESFPILSYLYRLTHKGWWTVGSQPAVDGVASNDGIYGWGPKGGYVFQKAFVEFFATAEDVITLSRKVNENGNGWITYFAGDSADNCLTNLDIESSNAVTWGVFPGQEVVQSTIIGRDSFLAWKEEAFSIWTEWASYYHPESTERKALDIVKSSRWLVSVVHHNYKDPNALWTFLLE